MDDNQIVYCDACNVAVHQACYGVATVPDGAWFCAPCGSAQRRGGGGGGRPAPPPGEGAAASRLACLLCLRLGGALKPTAGGGGGPDGTAPDGWVHVFCANWTPETYIEDTEAMEPITGLGSIPSERWRMQCTVCRHREGGCIQCAYSTCAAAFHPLCALEAGNTMQIRQRGDRLEYRGFCAKHSGAAAKGRSQKRPSAAAPKAGDGQEGSEEEDDDGGGEPQLGAPGAEDAAGAQAPGRRSRRRGGAAGEGAVPAVSQPGADSADPGEGEVDEEGEATRCAVKSKGGGSPDKVTAAAQGLDAPPDAPPEDEDDMQVDDAGAAAAAAAVPDARPETQGGGGAEPDDELMHIQEADLRDITAAAMTASGATAADVTGDDGALMTAWLSQKRGQGTPGKGSGGGEGGVAQKTPTGDGAARRQAAAAAE